MPESIPQFGEPADGVTYIDRPGVYGVIQDERGRIAVVKAGEGYFLPGGGVSPGETPNQAMSREALEECGRDARIIRPIGQANQRCTTRSGRHFNKLCRYFEAQFTPDPRKPPTEPDHELIWMTPPEALDCLMLESDVWALRQVITDRE